MTVAPAHAQPWVKDDFDTPGNGPDPALSPSEMH
jgi:hypothetical protein